MPYFDEVLELADYGNQKIAVNKVEAGLASNKAGVKKVFRVDLKNETIIGVSMTRDDCSSDKYIMGKIDFKKLKSTDLTISRCCISSIS